jgi:hypothetical protein
VVLDWGLGVGKDLRKEDYKTSMNEAFVVEVVILDWGLGEGTSHLIWG